MLMTPIGRIEIFIDQVPVEYFVTSIALDSRCNNLNGRYLIQINYRPDGCEHEISCRIKDYVSSKKDGIESGEMLELKSFYKEGAKVSIGMEGDSGYFSNGERVSYIYDYDNGYLDDGVYYKILSITKTQVFKFGIAWLNNCTETNDAQTWYGADTTLM